MKVVIIHEINCYEPPNGSKWEKLKFDLGLSKSYSYPGHCSIWICSSNEFDVNYEEGDIDAYTKCCTKLIGPIQADQGEEFLVNLKAGFDKCGIEYQVDVIPDD